MTDKAKNDLKKFLLVAAIVTIPGFFVGRYVDHVETTFVNHAQALEKKADTEMVVRTVDKIDAKLDQLDKKLDDHEVNSARRMRKFSGYGE